MTLMNNVMTETPWMGMVAHLSVWLNLDTNASIGRVFVQRYVGMACKELAKLVMTITRFLTMAVLLILAKLKSDGTVLPIQNLVSQYVGMD